MHAKRIEMPRESSFLLQQNVNSSAYTMETGNNCCCTAAAATAALAAIKADHYIGSSGPDQ